MSVSLKPLMRQQARIILLLADLDVLWWATHGRSALEELPVDCWHAIDKITGTDGILLTIQVCFSDAIAASLE